jgi:Relaxase/Mobilisation nuclease domain
VNVNGSSNRCIWWWENHLQSDVNEKVELVQSYGLRGQTIREMLKEMEALAAGTDCKNFFYQININMAPGEHLTKEQQDRARVIAEKAHGLEGQPFFEVRHTKIARAGHIHEHPHYIYLRVNLETGKTISDSFDAPKNHAIAREIEREFGLQKVIGPYDREPGTPRPKRAPKRWESYRARQSGLDIENIEAEVTELRQESQNGREFKAALENHGYILALGDRKTAGELTLMIVDPAGDEHSLARRLPGVTSKQLNEFMRDVDRETLPTIRAAQEQQQERKIAGLEAERDRYNQRWELAVMNAAIAKEEKERRFVEPGQAALPAPQIEKEPVIRMYRGIGNNVWPMMQGDALFFSTDPTRAARFGELHYVDVTAAEMAKFERPHSQRILEAEPVAKNDYRTADPAIIARLEPLESERTKEPKPEKTETRAGAREKEAQQQERQQPPAPQKEQPVSYAEARLRDILAAASAIRDNREGNPVPDAKAFTEALEQNGLAFAVATPEESYRSHRENAFARAIERKSDYFKPGEIVMVTEPRLERLRAGEWMEPPRVHKLDQAKAEECLTFFSIDKSKLKGIDATKEVLNASAQDRAAYWQSIRLERATDLWRGGLTRAGNAKDNLLKSPVAILKAASLPFNFGGKVLATLENLFEGLFAPKLTPQQIRQGEIAAGERQADAREQIDFSKWTADRAQEQRNHQELQAARDRERENDRGR